MRAFVIDRPGETSLIDISEPAMGERDVLLRVRIVGFCGTDLSTFRGVNPLVSYPRIPGHELGCTIEAIGAGVPGGFEIGQNVLVHPYQNCGQCSACRQNRPNACRDNQTLGVQREGGMTELLAVPFDKLYTSPTLTLREMALVEPLTIGYHAVMRGRVAAGETVGVFGCGAIGIGVIAAAAAKGANVIAIDVAEEKLALAKEVGAAHSINSASEELHPALQELTNRQGPQVMIEAVGLPATFRAAIEEAAFAGRVVYIGYSKQPVEYDTRHFVQRELDVLGSRNALPEDFRAVIAFLESGRMPIDEVITKTIPLDEAGAALADWDVNSAAVCKIHVSL
jgi:2-desacetyl-2-hydroxyethyl bacteriochlorophyllide A dehydrogenase